MCEQIIYNNFIDIVDSIDMDYNTYPLGKISFDSVLGSIEVSKTKESNKLIIHEIYVKEEYRNQGLCKEFIKCLIDKFPYKKIIIQSVLSKILYNFLLRFKYKNRYFILQKEGFCLI